MVKTFSKFQAIWCFWSCKKCVFKKGSNGLFLNIFLIFISKVFLCLSCSDFLKSSSLNYLNTFLNNPFTLKTSPTLVQERQKVDFRWENENGENLRPRLGGSFFCLFFHSEKGMRKLPPCLLAGKNGSQSLKFHKTSPTVQGAQVTFLLTLLTSFRTDFKRGE